MSGVELLMNNHQSLKAEIDTREDNFSACLSLGKELLSRNHYASQEVCTRRYCHQNRTEQNRCIRKKSAWVNGFSFFHLNEIHGG